MIAFIRAARDSQTRSHVFVHCTGGVARSPVVVRFALISFQPRFFSFYQVMVYLMSENGMSPDAALALVQARRPGVKPGEHFMLELQKLADVNE